MANQVLGMFVSAVQMSDLFFNYGICKITNTADRESVHMDATEWAEFFTYPDEEEKAAFIESLTDDFMDRL